jgi:hypothetical protein
MDQPNQQPRGDFVAFMNRDKQPGDNRPAFEGRISKPGSENKHDITLWAHEYTDPKTGEVKVMFNGQADAIARSAAPSDQINALVKQSDGAKDATMSGITLAPRQVVLFPNGFKSDAPEKQRPDYWGAYNPGDGSPIVRSSVWLKKDRSGRAFLSGATSYPLPGKSEVEQQAAEPNLHDLVETGQVSKGMPKKAKGRGE